MFTILHGLGYFQRWFNGLFEEDPRKVHGSNLPDTSSSALSRSDRVSYQLWHEKLHAEYRERGWLGIEKSEISHPASSDSRSSPQTSNDGYLDEGCIDDIDIRINDVRDIVAWDGRAKIESLFIGNGSYGQVNVQRYRKTLQPIAVKDFVFGSGTSPSHALHRLILHEANELAAVVGSDFFPRFYGLIILSRNHFMLAMEFVGDHKTGRTCPVSRALIYHGVVEGEETWINIVIDVCHGMTEFHSRQRLHNDLKSDNIMLFRCPRRLRWAAKIIDFGMISTFDRAKLFSFTDEEKTLYMKGDDYLHIAPEIVLGGAPTSKATDVFSLGYLMRDIAERKAVICLDVISRMCLNVEARHRPAMDEVKKYVGDLRSKRRMTTGQ